MIANKLLNTSFSPLTTSDSVSAALSKMEAWHTSNISVLDPITRTVVGQVTFDLLQNLPDETMTLGSLELKTPVYTYTNRHVFEVARQMLFNDVRFLTVVDENEQFSGIIEKKHVLEGLSTMLNIESRGSVITVMMSRPDFTLSELVHLIEQEEAKILGLTVSYEKEDADLLQISIKLNLEDTSAVVSALTRHGYTTTTENTEDLLQLDFTSRADELMRYFDI
ncbi:MAG: CBS domain-containing protein [Balneolaceae bacterium]